MSDLERALAKDFLDIVPRAMRAVRVEMRAIAKSDLTIPQFRILACLNAGPATNADVAEILGVSEPATCRMVAALVKGGLIKQVRSSSDRRNVNLELTPKGRAKFSSIKGKAQARFDVQFERLAPEQRKIMQQGLRIMAEVFR